MRRSILLAALLLLWGGVATAQVASRLPSQAGQRVALVVGIAAYEQAGPLQAPAGDAELMARTLQSFGFTLVGGGAVLEPDRRGLDSAIQEFGRQAQGADIAVFYFSGHGLQADGHNWLVARDSGPPASPPAGQADPQHGLVDVGAVLRQIEAAQPRLAILVLEACHGDPFRGREAGDAAAAGLAPMRAPRGTIIAFAAQPGSAAPQGGPGRRSAYTAALVETLRIPGLGLMQMLNEAALRALALSGGRQEPWLAISPLRGDFVFTARDGATRPDGRPPAEPPPASAPTVAPNPDFTLVNFAGRPVRELRASPARDAPGGEDRLEGNLLQAGERFRLTFPRDHGCQVDVSAGFGQGAPPSEIRDLDTCRVDMLLLTPQGRLIPANPDVRLVNETGRAIRHIEAALASDGDWGPDRLSGEVMPPGGTLDLHLPQGLSCDIDIRARFADGTSREWRRQDTCAVSQYALQ